MALVVFVVVLAARLRAASVRLTELQAQRDRDVGTLAKAPQEALRMPATDDELKRLQTALADAQSALAAMRVERDGAIREVAAAHRERHAFLAGLAHDLRNPLAPLSNGIELLRLTDADPTGRLRTRGIMERQIGHLMRMADELSDLARLSGDQAALQRAPFDLAAVLRDLVERLAPALQAQEMTLELAPGPMALPRLRGDAQRVAQAVAHLVNDVARHAERGSTIRIAVQAADAALMLSIATAADLDPEPPVGLEDVDVATLGLGVALALRLATLHGGSLRGQRPPGARRVRFTLGLPVDPTATASADAGVA